MKEYLRTDGEVHELDVIEQGGSTLVSVDGVAHEIGELKREGAEIAFRFGDRTYRFLAVANRKNVTVWREGNVHRGERVEGTAARTEEAGSGASLTSQMPGIVLKLLLEPGVEVKQGTPLLILEAMKMEHEVCAPSDGKLVAYPFKEGDRVMPGDLLVEFEPTNEP